MARLSKNGKPIGRPPGSKNAATLLKEAGREKVKAAARDTALHHSPKLMEAMAKLGMQGNVNAAKLVMSYGIGPAEQEAMGKGQVNIQINVEPYDAQATIRRESDTYRQISAETSTLEVEPPESGAEGEPDEARQEVIA